MDTWVTGLFRGRGAAERAAEALIRAGFAVDDISVLTNEDTRAPRLEP